MTDQTETTLDRAALDAIRTLDGDGAAGLLRRVVRLYFETGPRLIVELNKARAEGRLEDVSSAAHSLRSSSANLGATQMARMCQMLEHAARAGMLGADLPYPDAIEREFAAVRRALEQEIPE